LAGTLNAAKEFLNLSFKIIDIDVAYNDDALIVGTIPLMVIVAQTLGAKLSIISILPIGMRLPYLLPGYIASMIAFEHALHWR
jgi:hypothetical protein